MAHLRLPTRGRRSARAPQLSPAQQALAAARAALAEAEAAVRAEEAAAKRKVKADRIAQKIDPALARLQAQIDRLSARKAQLERRRAIVCPPAPEAPHEAPAKTRGATPRTEGGAKDQPWKRSVTYQFWLSYQRQFKIKAHTQALLTRTCKKHGIDQSMPTVATLTTVRDLILAGK